MPIVSGQTAKALGWGAQNIPPAPTLLLLSQSDTQIQYRVTNYDSVAGISAYNVSGTNATKSISGSNLLITQTPLSPETSYTLSVSITKNGFTSPITTITNFTRPIAPTFALVSRTTTSITWDITNYDSARTYSLGPNTISAINTSTGEFTQSGLTAGTNTAIIGNANKNSLTSASGTSSRWTIPATPNLSLQSSAINSLTIKINNFNNSYTYQYNVVGGASNQNITSDPFTVSGLNPATTYTINVFASVDGGTSAAGTITATTTKSTTFPADVLVVAGGGGGGPGGNGVRAGGGGAGGLIYQQNITLSMNTSYLITVGAGGSGGTPTAYSTNGSDSRIASPSFNYYSYGGGYGGSSGPLGNYNGNLGGSGGGGTGYFPTSLYTTAGGGSWPGQGNPGRSGFLDPDGLSTYGGGGGGASAAAINQIGGRSRIISITGSAAYYAGGGGAGGASGVGAGSGGIGSGGAGGPGLPAGNGVIYTGGGGGGGGGTNGSPYIPGGTGGAGVIILKIPNAYVASFDAGSQATNPTTPSPGYNIYRIIAAGPSSNVTFS